MGYRPWGRRESDSTKQLTVSLSLFHPSYLELLEEEKESHKEGGKIR